MSNGFEIRLDETRAVAMGGVMETVSDLFQRILEKARELLTDNLPPWDVVQAGVRAAYDLYIRPLSIPNFIDNILVNALVREVKKIYDSLAAS